MMMNQLNAEKTSWKLSLESDDDLPLGKTFNILRVIIAAASVLEKNGIIHNFFNMNASISYKNVTVQKH